MKKINASYEINRYLLLIILWIIFFTVCKYAKKEERKLSLALSYVIWSAVVLKHVNKKSKRIIEGHSR